MQILGIETSCDETAAAVVTDKREIKSNILRTQMQEHMPYGGVVPEVAARSHMETLEEIVREALDKAGTDLKSLDGIAVTAGPGLIGGVMVGLMMAKSIAAVHNLPFLAVNHLAGHTLTPRLTHDIPFPYLLLLVSGGHTQLLVVRDATHFELLGTSIDDAVGEAFDKSARLLGHPYPGGPVIEKYAKNGDEKAYDFPRPLISRRAHQHSPYTFSLAGLKTAVRTEIQNHGDTISNQAKSDVCASFQAAVGDILSNRTQHAITYCKDNDIPIKNLVVAGGVAANTYLNQRLQSIAEKNTLSFVAPPVALCTDNGAMIAWAGIEKLRAGLVDTLDFAPRARWPLAE
ncbi:MAG: tRNA (adenosine(37)-N6)-threonylcarbamoyltransferase complex transferase subunit TsaD [Alphaproteobacteria bacterium]